MVRITIHNPLTGYIETLESEMAVVLSTKNGEMTVVSDGVEDEEELCETLREAHDHVRGSERQTMAPPVHLN